jgi:hypothetical protein
MKERTKGDYLLSSSHELRTKRASIESKCKERTKKCTKMFMGKNDLNSNTHMEPFPGPSYTKKQQQIFSCTRNES